MSNGEFYSISQIHNWGNMALSHKLQKTQSWNLFLIHWYQLQEESPRVWSQDQCPGHSPGDYNACEGDKCHWAQLGCPAPELIGTEININIASWKMGRRTIWKQFSKGTYTISSPWQEKTKDQREPQKRITEDFQRIIQGMEITIQETLKKWTL